MKYQNDGIFTDIKRSGRPKVTSSREDRLMHQIVTRSPLSSSKKIRAKLMDTGTAVSFKRIQRWLSLEFELKSYRPARKLRLTETMQKNDDWNTEMWKRVLFSDESSVNQFSVRKYRVWRRAGSRCEEKYTVPAVKHPPSQMV